MELFLEMVTHFHKNVILAMSKIVMLSFIASDEVREDGLYPETLLLLKVID